MVMSLVANQRLSLEIQRFDPFTFLKVIYWRVALACLSVLKTVMSGMAWGFDSLTFLNLGIRFAPIGQMVESVDLKFTQCWFESNLGHNLKAGVLKLVDSLALEAGALCVRVRISPPALDRN